MTEIRVEGGFAEDNDADEVVVGEWIFEDGAEVNADDVIVEIMASKVTMEIVAPVSGKLKIAAQTDDLLKGGDLIATIE